MMNDTPLFIEPDDVNGEYAPLPVFVTRTTLLAMVEDATQEQKPATKEFAAYPNFKAEILQA